MFVSICSMFVKFECIILYRVRSILLSFLYFLLQEAGTGFEPTHMANVHFNGRFLNKMAQFVIEQRWCLISDAVVSRCVIETYVCKILLHLCVFQPCLCTIATFEVLFLWLSLCFFSILFLFSLLLRLFLFLWLSFSPSCSCFLFCFVSFCFSFCPFVKAIANSLKSLITF